MGDPVRVRRARLGGLVKHHGPTDPDVLDARRELKAALLRRHVEQVVAEAPPLTVEQRAELAALLTAPSPTVGGGPDGS